MHRNIVSTNTVDSIIASAITSQSIEALADQFPLKITAEEKKDRAVIRISGTIFQWKNSADWFRRQIEDFNEKGITSADLFITTPGGDVMQAAEIHNEIKAFNGKITGYGGAMVASAGTYIRLACDDFYMVGNGKWMYHKPSGIVRGNEDQWEAKLKLLKSITSDYREGYAELTGLSEKDIETNWAKGDVWLSAKEAEKEGWISGISSYKAKIRQNEQAMFSACGTPNPPKPRSKPKSKKEMDIKLVALQLGLDENASEEQVKAEMAKLKKSASEVDKIKAEADKKEKDAQNKEIKALLDSAQENKKITATQREGLESFAKADFDAFKAHLENLDAPGKISDQIAGKSKGHGSTASLKAKKFEDLTAEDQAKLEEDDPKAFEAKYEAYLESLEE